MEGVQEVTILERVLTVRDFLKSPMVCFPMAVVRALLKSPMVCFPTASHFRNQRTSRSGSMRQGLQQDGDRPKTRRDLPMRRRGNQPRDVKTAWSVWPLHFLLCAAIAATSARALMPFWRVLSEHEIGYTLVLVSSLVFVAYVAFYVAATSLIVRSSPDWKRVLATHGVGCAVIVIASAILIVPWLHH